VERPAPPATPIDRPISNYKVAGVVLVGVAAVGLVAGIVTGVLVLDKKDEIETQCGLAGDAAACTPDGKAAADSAQALATASTVSFISAAATGGLALTLFLVEPRDTVAGVTLSPRVAIAGHF
jgi:hypothetical protein